jgi:hypothetical protein
MKSDPNTIGQPQKPFMAHLLPSAFLIFIGLLIWIPGSINHSSFSIAGMVLSGAGLIWCAIILVLTKWKHG